MKIPMITPRGHARRPVGPVLTVLLLAFVLLPTVAADFVPAWVGTWATSPRAEEASKDKSQLQGGTLRQVVRTSLGGHRLRVRLSNVFGTTPLVLHGVHLALAGSGGEILPETDRALHFNGNDSVSIPPGVSLLSDPLDFDLPSLADVAITIHFSEVPAILTMHHGSRTNSYLQTGNFLAAQVMPDAAKIEHWYFISAIDVLSDVPAAAVVILGDSITDGRGTTTDKNNRWTDVLASRLHAQAGAVNIGVLNQGIGGNRILRDGLGQPMLARFDRDVLQQTGARWVIVQAGINDIGSRIEARKKGEPFVSAVDIIAGFQQLVARAHAQGMKIIGTTIMPYAGADFYWSADGEADRQTINTWIRTSGHFDAVIDFDAAVRDPLAPTRLAAAFDCGDHLHLSPAGYAAMAGAVDLSLFPVSAPSAPTPLPEGVPLLAGDSLKVFTEKVDPAAKANAKLEVVDAVGPGFTRAWRIATLQDTSPMAAIELRALNAVPVAVDEVALLRFFARATEISDETGGGRVQLVIRRNGVDWNSSFEGDFPLTREWQEFIVPFVWGRDFAVDGGALMFRFGFKRQTVEIGGIDAITYGRTRSYESLPRTRFSYAGREPDAQWRKDALARIDKIRKSDFVVRVTGADGKPVSGATVRVEQRRSAFEWGSALQMERLVVDSPDNLRYRQITEELFNAASTENDLKWTAWMGDMEGNFSHEQTLAGLRWLRARGFHARGHVLVWPGRKNLPNKIKELLGTPRQGEIPSLVIDHIREISRVTRGLLDEWDVLNEPFTNYDLMDAFGREVMPPWFKVAREELPGVKLFLNDFSNLDATVDGDHVAHFEQTTRFLLEHGAPVDGLGMQAHFNGRPSAPENMLAVLDRYYTQFHLPVRMTEFDVWTRDEALQADFTRDFLILSFSHPSVIGVQHWGFWETCHWRPPAAMFRADWSEKPNAKVYRDLVLNQWRTNVTGVTDGSGFFRLRGFHGDYTVVVEVGERRAEKTFSITPGTKVAELKVALP